MKKTFKIFCNSYKKSKDMADCLRVLLERTNKFCEIYGAQVPDFAFAIGGDGTFLHSVKACDFPLTTKFIGINTGTLGFLQVVKPDQIEQLVHSIATENYQTQKLTYLVCNIITENDTVTLKCLNEFVARDKALQIVNLKINIDNEPIETFVGDGVLIATSTGSTAYNLSLCGSIVHNQFHTLQLTPIAPLTTIAHSLTNSIVMPETSVVEIIPLEKTKNLILSADGANTVCENVKTITVSLSKKHINAVIMPGQSFFKKLNEKILRRGTITHD